MSGLQYSILVLLLLADDRFSSSWADQQPDSISAIIESYANAFTTNKPAEQRRITTPLFQNLKVKDSTYLYDFTTISPEEQRHNAVPAYSNIELKVADSHPVHQNFNGYADLSAEESEEDADPKGPPDHIIPFTEHENPKEPSTRPNYTAPGDWAKPPAGKNIPLEFIPNKLYAQVRGTHTVKRLPQEEAIKSAKTDEEKENAARLKEVVKILKANTVYTEEGYEDAAYDHAGQIRDADFHEGFARKLKDELEKKKIHDSDGKKPTSAKLSKPRKSKSRDLDDFSDDYRDHLTEVIEEARTSKQRIKPESLKALKGALSSPAVDPKIITEDGILQLEQDLKKESYEVQKTSTEPYSITTTTYTPPATELISQNKIEYETTTARHEVFTIRPRRPATTARPKAYVAKIRRPTRYYPVSKNNGNYEDYSKNPFSDETTTANYGNLFWQYFVNKENQTPAVTYPPMYSETQTVSPVIANPLAVATVNGHGPYLVVVTSAPNAITTSPLENQGFETTIQYAASFTENATKPTLINSYVEHNPFLITEARNRKITGQGDISQYSPTSQNNNPQVYNAEQKMTEKIFKFPKIKPSQNHAKIMTYLKNEKNNYMDYYKVMQPPKAVEALVTYPDYSRSPYGNVLGQWSVAQESERPIESVYDVLDNAERPRVKPAVQKSLIPVTRLLPPAPLSSSEYASFHMRGRRNEPIPPSLMAIMPIIEAIHKRENKRKPFPFLFRKKRALGHTREWEILQRDKRIREAEMKKLAAAGSQKSETNSSNIKYPPNFEQLLNDSPRIATDIVDKEIRERFTDASNKDFKEPSDEASDEESDETFKEISNESTKEKVKDKDDAEDKNSVEVEVPELDFSSVFEEDEVEPTTKKPGIDTEKYPFYKNSKVTENTALKYIVNPMAVPQKTLGGMEFYNSRGLECEEIDPNLEKIVPEEEELANKRGPRKSKPRLRGLGDKLDCYKAKYFDENPFDNPLFFESGIGIPSPPTELDPKQFASRILELSPEKDEYVIPSGPKSPENYGSLRRQVTLKNIPRHMPHQTIDFNSARRSKKHGVVQLNHPRNRGPPGLMSSNENRIRSNKTRSRPSLKKSNLKVSPAYQRQVYEDVMGTIMNMEKMYKTPVPKRGSVPIYYNYNQHNRQQENIAFEMSKKRRPDVIDGLVPPPQRQYNMVPYKNNRFMYANQRNNRHTLSETPTQHLRIYKRSISVNNITEVKNALNQTNNATKINEESTFRIIMTTPLPEKPKRKRKTVTIITDEPPIERPTYTNSDRLKCNRSADDKGKYDKFVDKENVTLSIDLRRKEPRYNISNRRNTIINTTSPTTIRPIKVESPKVTSQPSTDPSFSGSTLIPVIVKPDDNFTSRIPQESKTSYTKQKIETPDSDEHQEKSNDYSIEDDEKKEEKKNSKNENAQYLVHESIEEDPKKVKSKEVTTDFTGEPDSEEHKALIEFLNGDPPGYSKTFGHETTPEYEESKSKESLENEEQKESHRNEEENDRPEEESSKETYVGESTSDEAEEEPKENAYTNKDEEENSGSSSRESENEPFVRYSSRPTSPSENYEDHRYSDLGPRVNKPYFYHPPFEVPEYEKFTLGKAVDRSDDDDWGHSAETEDHEKYVFPWENDKDDEEKGDETKSYSILGRYEFPWERRERKERERKKRERLQKKYGKRYFHYKDEDDDGKEATNTRLIYVPLKKNSRGKKDVHKFEGSSERRPITKFSSKYKSGILKVPLDDEEMLITVANNDEIKQSIINYLENIKASAPKIKTSQTQKSILNDTFTISTTNLPNKINRKNDLISKVEATTQKPVTSFSTSKSIRTSRTTVIPTLTTISNLTTPRYQNRLRSRKVKPRINNDNKSDKIKLPDQTTERQTSTTSTAKPVRRRGRIRDSKTSATTLTTTSSPAKSNVIRRRNRPTSSTATPNITSTTARVTSERRRRPFRIQHSVEKGRTSPKPEQNSFTTLSSIPTSTGRTIEHHSRVSKEEIITKTFYPDDDDDDDEDDDDIGETPAKRDNSKATSEKKPIQYSKLNRRSKPKNESHDEPHATKKEKVEKVTITMEETPNHVYRTKEIDKDGVKGKFITITANNNSTPPKRNDSLREGDAEMEEMKRKMDAFNSFDSVIRDTEDLTEEPSGIHAAENYLVGNLLQRLPLPMSRGSKVDRKEDIHLPDRRASEDDDSDDDDDDDTDNENDQDKDNGSDDDEDEDDDDDDDDNSNDESKNDRIEGSKTEKNVIEKPPVVIIKDPANRRYFYVEER